MPGAHVERRRPGRPERRVGEVPPLVGVAQQVVAERGAGAEHAEQPHRGALVGGDRVQQLRRGRRPGRRGRRGSATAWSGSAATAPRCTSSSAGGPMPVQGRSGASRRRGSRAGPGGPVVVLTRPSLTGAPAPRPDAAPTKRRGQRLPGGPQLGLGGGHVGDVLVDVDAALDRVVAVVVGPDRTMSPPASGCHCTPQTVGAKRAACTSPCGVRASSTAPSGRRATMSLFHCAARAGAASPARTAGRPPAASVQPTSSTPTCWPRGFGTTVPPSATAAQLVAQADPPASARPASAACRTSSLTSAEPGVAGVVVGAHRCRPAPPARRARRGRPAARRRRTGGVRRGSRPPRRATRRPSRAGRSSRAGRRGSRGAHAAESIRSCGSPGQTSGSIRSRS